MKKLERTFPEYAENIVTFVIFRNRSEWYVAPKELWVMDLIKEYYSFKKKCAEIGWTEKRILASLGTPDEIGKDRCGTAVLDSDNAEKFLEYLRNCLYTTDELREFYLIADEDEKYDFFPSLYIDFDKKELCSFFPEPVSFENFVPVG
mgnify:CR=1 FL=1